MAKLSFKDWQIQINQKTITDFAAGNDSVSITWNSDLVSSKVGADGKIQLQPTNDNSAVVAIKLQAQSPDNAFIMALINGQVSLGKVLPIGMNIANITTGSTITCLNGTLKKRPDLKFGNEFEDNTYEFVFEDVVADLNTADGIIDLLGKVVAGATIAKAGTSLLGLF